MNKQHLNNLEKKGYTIIDSCINKTWSSQIKEALPPLFDLHKSIRIKNNNNISSNEIAMNVLASDDIFIDFLQYLIDINLIPEIEENYFKTKCILNSFSAISNIPSESNVFYKKMHRDIRGYTNNVPILLNMLVMVDDFTVENGGTLLLPMSHLIENEPTKQYWERNAIHATGKAGDVVIWNSNIYHASGINKTNENRRGLPITLSLPYYKQLLDYPKALGYDRINNFNPDMQRLLGYHSRVPTSISEWYSPINKRLYK